MGPGLTPSERVSVPSALALISDGTHRPGGEPGERLHGTPRGRGPVLFLGLISRWRGGRAGKAERASRRDSKRDFWNCKFESRAVSLMDSIKTAVIPEPKAGTRSFLTIPSGPIIIGQGDDNYVCGACGNVLAQAVTFGQIRNIVFKCNKCGAFSEVTAAN